MPCARVTRQMIQSHQVWLRLGRAYQDLISVRCACLVLDYSSLSRARDRKIGNCGYPFCTLFLKLWLDKTALKKSYLTSKGYTILGPASSKNWLRFLNHLKSRPLFTDQAFDDVMFSYNCFGWEWALHVLHVCLACVPFSLLAAIM